MTTLIEAARQALEALEWVPDRHAPKCKAAITALRQALANEALDRMAENARELGLDYEPAGGTQVSKVWWDGDKLIAKPIPLSEVYKELEQQPADEPVAWVCLGVADRHDIDFDEDDVNALPVGTMLYTNPHRDDVPAKAVEWVGLTDEEIEASKPPLSNDAVVWELAVEWAEAKLREKNGGQQ